MDTRFTVKNFRAFGQDGVSLDLRPITILTGCNSSGKSSLVKSLMLLSDFVDSYKFIAEGQTPKLDFRKKPLSLLGNFETVLNRQAVKDGNSVMSVSYDVQSPYIGEKLTVSMEFGLDAKDLKKNGFVKKLNIADSAGNVLISGLSSRIIENYLHPNHRKYRDFFGLTDYGMHNTSLSEYKVHFFSFALTVLALKVANFTYSEYVMDGSVTKEEMKKQIMEVRDFLQEIKVLLGKETILSTVDYYSTHMEEASKMLTADPDLLEKAAKANILTYLPVLELLDGVSKESFATKFRELIKECSIEGKAASSSRIDAIIADFLKSDYSLFSDYYRKLEEQFLNSRFTGSSISDVDDFYLKSIDIKLEEEESACPVVETGQCEDLINFEKVFRLLCDLDRKATGIRVVSDQYTPETYYNHDILKDFAHYRTTLVSNVLATDICEHLTYVGSSRIDVQRLYSLDVQDNFGQTISEYFEALRLYNTNREYKPGSFINKWIKEFGIGERFTVEPLENGIGVVLKIYEGQNDSEGKLLADFGYGISQLVSILIEIETAILHAEEVRDSSVVDYSKGVADLFKVFNGTYKNIAKPRTIAIEEPEIHLHPDYQALLADMFFEAYSKYNIQFIIETHSEYLVRRCQIRYRKLKDAGKENPFSIYYFPKCAVPYEMVFSQTGHFENKFGEGFYDAAARDALELSKMAKGIQNG